MLRFLPNLSITPLPAKELNELYAAFLTEFVYYSPGEGESFVIFRIFKSILFFVNWISL